MAHKNKTMMERHRNIFSNAPNSLSASGSQPAKFTAAASPQAVASMLIGTSCSSSISSQVILVLIVIISNGEVLGTEGHHQAMVDDLQHVQNQEINFLQDAKTPMQSTFSKGKGKEAASTRPLPEWKVGWSKALWIPALKLLEIADPLGMKGMPGFSDGVQPATMEVDSDGADADDKDVATGPAPSGSNLNRYPNPSVASKADIRDLNETLHQGFEALLASHKAMGENFAKLIDQMEKSKIDDSNQISSSSSIRIHLNNLLKGASPLIPTVNPMESSAFSVAWMASDGAEVACEADSFRIDILGTPRSPWNISAGHIFAATLISANGYPDTEDVVEQIQHAFATRIKSLQRDYQVSQLGPAQKQQGRSQHNRSEWKINLFHHHRNIVKKYDGLHHHIVMLDRMGPDGMSSDELEVDAQGRSYVVW
ncbi:hypothetical protein JAAARDRAFT_50036 [Jaapia argillacea MUCL 33604]|uniref:Uncharacterized protein n=1 Tax=Jaapia argillacea MUCL 33604 TaxID=933084 RepID=A0A067PP46_9AGAM|nr:hypothetical protein JAAARDRAFT_50036 [Jaapia argillacea MUCL 33604]